jgi:hypothetical protein
MSGNYAPSKPYDDSPQYIGFDATISAPHMHAAALEYLHNHVQVPNDFTSFVKTNLIWSALER